MMVTFGCQGSVKSVKFPGKKEENIEMLIHQHATTACEHVRPKVPVTPPYFPRRFSSDRNQW
jgi:hypothetical protein